MSCTNESGNCNKWSIFHCWELTVITMGHSAYIRVISEGCCCRKRNKKCEGVLRVNCWQEKEREWGVSTSFRSLLYDHWSAPSPSPPLYLCVRCGLQSLSLPHSSLPRHGTSLSLPSASLSPQWGWHPRIWWSSEAFTPAGGFRGRPHMNGIIGRGGAASKEPHRKPISWSSLPVSTSLFYLHHCTCQRRGRGDDSVTRRMKPMFLLRSSERLQSLPQM